jgi:hypothetical protein
MTHGKLATEVDKYISLLPVHTVTILIVFDHAAK